MQDVEYTPLPPSHQLWMGAKVAKTRVQLAAFRKGDEDETLMQNLDVSKAVCTPGVQAVKLESSMSTQIRYRTNESNKLNEINELQHVEKHTNGSTTDYGQAGARVCTSTPHCMQCSI